MLADKTLPWWMLGISVIAVNISAEQLVGMVGSGYRIGLAIASYEWMSALALILVAKYLLPIYVKRGLYTLPQLLQQQINRRVRQIISAYWLILNVLVNLTAIFWLGGDMLSTLTGVTYSWLILCLLLLACLPLLGNGMRALSISDLVNITLIITLGLSITVYLLNYLTLQMGQESWFSTLMELYQQQPEKFELLLTPSDEFYQYLPGLSVLFGGMWLMNLSYWGINQYTVQRLLCGKNLAECQKGALFAAAIKLTLPLLLVLPGILIATITTLPQSNPNLAYPTIFTLAPIGLKGGIVVVVLAATISSLSSIALSVASLFTVDLSPVITQQSSAKAEVKLAKLTALFALMIGAGLSIPLLNNFQQSFQFIQQVAGIITPAIFCIFISCLLFNKSSSINAILPIITSIITTLILKSCMENIAFMHQLEIVFALIVVVELLLRYVYQRQEYTQFSRVFLNVEHVFPFKKTVRVITIIVLLIYIILG